MAIRYRTGVDQRSGRPLSGWAHCVQSIGVILTTSVGECVMALDFGAKLVSHLGNNLVPPIVLAIYTDATDAVHREEPEFRIVRLQLVKADRTGSLHLGMWGDYYPEGRLGNYDLVEPRDGYFVLKAGEAGGARIGAN